MTGKKDNSVSWKYPGLLFMLPKWAQLNIRRGFGKFCVKKKWEGRCRNPQMPFLPEVIIYEETAYYADWHLLLSFNFIKSPNSGPLINFTPWITFVSLSDQWKMNLPCLLHPNWVAAELSRSGEHGHVVLILILFRYQSLNYCPMKSHKGLNFTFNL